jgi:hypothetical protein
MLSLDHAPNTQRRKRELRKRCLLYRGYYSVTSPATFAILKHGFFSGPFSSVDMPRVGYAFNYRFMSNISSAYPRHISLARCERGFTSITREYRNLACTDSYKKALENWHESTIGSVRRIRSPAGRDTYAAHHRHSPQIIALVLPARS